MHGKKHLHKVSLPVKMQTQKHSTQIPTLIQNLLSKRGIADHETQKAFLFPSLANLPAPQHMLNLEVGADLAIEYILNKKKIIIWGDYDVDGTTGTSLLVLFFRSLGIETIWHIPNRLVEGYGLNIDWFIDNNTNFGNDFLLITVDCGIGDAAIVEQVQAMGGKVIITDHHLIPENFEPKCVVINPSQSDCGFHDHCLAGAGVAFYLSAAIRKRLSTIKGYEDIYQKINLKDLLPLVALGTLSDIVPLTSVNRILTRAGMEAMSSCKIPGLVALLKSCDIESGEVSSEDVGYLIGPKINAAGRLGESRAVVELFIENDQPKVKRLAGVLLRMNNERKAISDSSLEIVLTNLSKNQIMEEKCIVVAGNYHKGVAGIVASKLVDLHKVPVLVLCDSIDNSSREVLVGSARSIEGVNIIEVFNQSSRYLEKFGGHAMAAGLSLLPENKNDFIQILKRNLKLAMQEVDKIAQLNPADIECTIDELFQHDTIDTYKLLEPFGPLNPQPVFASPRAVVIDSRKVGNNGDHLSVTFRTKYSKIKGIGFNLGDRLEDVQDNPTRKIIFSPTLNRFRGTTSWQVRLLGI